MQLYARGGYFAIAQGSHRWLAGDLVQSLTSLAQQHQRLCQNKQLTASACVASVTSAQPPLASSRLWHALVHGLNIGLPILATEVPLHPGKYYSDQQTVHKTVSGL